MRIATTSSRQRPPVIARIDSRQAVRGRDPALAQLFTRTASETPTWTTIRPLAQGAGPKRKEVGGTIVIEEFNVYRRTPGRATVREVESVCEAARPSPDRSDCRSA